MLDLQQFCGTDECRHYLMKPFSRDGFTWATDGRILVRVPLRPDVPAIEQKLNFARPLAGIESGEFFKPAFNLPPAPPAPTETGPCRTCDGRGFDHDCPHCECICDFCHGSGEADKEARISTKIGPRLFSLRYVRLMLSLPGVELAAHPAKPNEKPLLFRFEEGVGALMPMRSAYETHVEI